jgi:hypothetical protein
MPPVHANGSPVLDEPPLTPPQSPPLTSLFGFGSLPGEEELESLLPGQQADPELGSGTGWPSDEQLEQPGSEQPDTATSSKGSSDSPLSKGQLKETFRAGVRISTSTAHRLAARTPGQQHVGLYLADETDVKGIGDPLAEIAHRRGGLAGGALSPDTNNALQAVMALAGYIAKQLKGVEQARQLDGQIAAGVVQVADVDEVA